MFRPKTAASRVISLSGDPTLNRFLIRVNCPTFCAAPSRVCPPGFRTVFTLRDIEHLSTEETAEALNLSVPAVKSRLLRARLQLRERLSRYFKKRKEEGLPA